MECPRCGRELTPLDRECPHCARVAPLPDVECAVCHAPNNPKLTACQVCGASIGLRGGVMWGDRRVAPVSRRLAAQALDSVLIVLAHAVLLAALWLIAFLVLPGTRTRGLGEGSFVDWRVLVAVADLPPLTVPLTVSWIRCLQPCP